MNFIKYFITFSVFSVFAGFTLPGNAITLNKINNLGSPNDVTRGAQESDSELFLFKERENFKLTEDITVQLDGSSGTFTGSSLSSNSGSISEGTPVDSFYIFFDSENNNDNFSLKTTPSITFDRQILGIQTDRDFITPANSTVGLSPSVSYEADQQIGGNDQLILSGSTITFDNLTLGQGSNQDVIRVVTEPTQPVPVVLNSNDKVFKKVNFIRKTNNELSQLSLL
jgi:hypothetical protein